MDVSLKEASQFGVMALDAEQCVTSFVKKPANLGAKQECNILRVERGWVASVQPGLKARGRHAFFTRSYLSPSFLGCKK